MVKLLCVFGLLLEFCVVVAGAQNVTLVGTLQAANQLPAVNYSITLEPSQVFYIAGTSVVVNTTVACATSVDGSVVGTRNPLLPLTSAAQYGAGTLPAGIYYFQYAWYDAAGHLTLPSPEQQAQLTSTGKLLLLPNTSGQPATAVGMKLYIGTTSGGETLQGSTTGTGFYTQSTPLTSGAYEPTTNNTVCSVVANDAGWPTGTGYWATFTDLSGNTLPGFPMLWRLLDPGTTINLSQGLPTYNGQVTYPSPILATPFNHTPQSISGPLSLGGYKLLNVSNIGVNTAVPAYGVDVEGTGAGALINANGGYLLNGSGGAAGQVLSSDGTAFNTPVPLPPTPLTGTTGTITGTALTNSCDSGTVGIAGAVVGHPVAVSSTTGVDVGAAFNVRATVRVSNNVTVYVCGTGTPPSLAYNVTVF